MAYKATIPQPADKFSISQADLLNNFGAINTLVAADHIGFNLANAGKHKTATFPQAAAPGAVLVTEVGLYAKSFNGAAELYINKNGSQVPFTASSQIAEGWSYLASGVIIKWGVRHISGSSTTTFAYPSGAGEPVFKAGSTPVVSLTIVTSGSSTVSLTASTNTGFTAHHDASGARDFHYIAIGY